MKKTLVTIIFSSVIWALGVGSSSALVLDFEDIVGVSGRTNLPALGISSTYQGFQWPNYGSNPWGVVDNTDSQFSTVGAYSGTQALWNWSNGPERNIIFNSVQDVAGAYFNVFAAGQSWGADTVQFRAYDEFDVLIGTSAIIALDDSSPSPSWQWLEAGFTGVMRLNVLSAGGWWSMDDLTLNQSAEVQVYEPTAISILSLGIVILSLARRRRVAQHR